MKEKHVILDMTDGKIDMLVDIYGWARCTLMQGKSEYYLGADLIEKIAKSILKNMGAADRESADGIEGGKRRWVLSLSEAHCSMYYRKCSEGRVVFLEDCNGKTVGQYGITEGLYAEWCTVLSEVTGISNKKGRTDVL